MPCIWGKHNGSQVFLNVAIFEDAVLNQLSATKSDVPVTIHVFGALVDTGAQSTCITRAAAEKVGLTPIGKVPIRGVSGLSFHNNYLFRVGFAFSSAGEQDAIASAQVHILNGTVEGAELNIQSDRFDVLLGMDVIGRGSLKIDGDGSFSYSF